MKNRNQLFLALGVTMLLALGGIVYAKHTVADHKAGLRAGLASKFASLGITDEQKTEIRSILRDHRETAVPLLKDYVQARRALREAVRASPINEDAIRGQVNAAARHQAELAIELAHIGQEVRGVLTEEQRQQTEDMLKDMDLHVDEILDRIGNRVDPE